MKRFLSFYEVALLATLLLSVGTASALHAQTSANSSVTNSTGHDITAYGVLRQDSGERPLIFSDPEAILGHTLLSKVGTGNTAIQGATGNYFTAASAGAAINRRYCVTDLGTLGGTESFAYAINGFAQVVGASRIAGDASTHAFLYSDGRMIDLYPLTAKTYRP